MFMLLLSTRRSEYQNVILQESFAQEKDLILKLQKGMVLWSTRKDSLSFEPINSETAQIGAVFYPQVN